MKKNKHYILTGLVAFLILAVVFLFKGIFPFGSNSVIWGDMHDQITAFYYHFYDCVYGSKSLFINFSTSGGINFLGILAYYILSPFSVLVLLIPRTNIYLMVSVIVMLKIVACSITCLYFIKKYFKNIPGQLQSLLALTYAFSGYSLVMYQITPWIDAMYMLPLVMIGLKKVLDLEKPHFYIITLSLSLIFSFYVSMMTLMFIFLIAFIYLLVYKEKAERMRAITSLGISTLLSLLIASLIIIPAYLEISISSRIGFSLKALLNSKTGPLSDKLSMIAFGGVVYLGIILLIQGFKRHKKFLTFYVPTLLFALIPVIIEPINKVFHFGTYASFPLRFGYILMFLMILGAAYGFDNYKSEKENTFEINKYATIFASISVMVLIIRYTSRYYNRLQAAIYRLSISFDTKLIFILLLTTLLATIGSVIILVLNKKINRLVIITLSAICIVHITANTFVYIGNDKNQDVLTKEYKLLADISKDYDGSNYRIKNNLDILTNSGMVMKYNSLDHFTSLTNKNNLESLKKLGYASEWVKTRSKGSNIFIDTILANKYLLSPNRISSPYYELVKSYNGAKLYTLKYNIPYGVLINKNDTILDKNNSFEIANSLYKNITNSSEDLFTIDNNFALDNIGATILEDGMVSYKIIDDDYYAYLEKDIIVTGRKNLYLEINHYLDNKQNFRINEAFNLYVNSELISQDIFTEPDNGTYDLGIFENKRVNIKLELKKPTILKDVTVGSMDVEKYNSFVDTYNSDNNIKFKRNKITLKVNNTADSEKILLLPIAYDSSYSVKVNGSKVDLLKVYDNFIGIKVGTGESNITISYIPKGFIPTLIISIFTIIISIILIKKDLYFKLIDNEILKKGLYYIYLSIYLVFILVVYIALTLCFMLSYLKFINI